MANELFAVPGAVFYAKVETTYNTDPTIASTDRRYVESVEFDAYKPEMIQREGLSAFRPGWRPVQGKVSAPFSFTVELDHKTVNGTTPTPPECDFALRMCGFERTDTSNTDFTSANVSAVAGNNDEIISYALSDRIGSGSSSARIEYTEAVEGGSEGLKWTVTGARGDWTLNINAGERITFEVNGLGITTEPAKVSTPTLNDTLPTGVQPMVAQGFVGISIADLTGDSVYGGGTAGSAPAMGTAGSGADVTVLAATFSGNLNLQEDMGIDAAGSVKRVRQRPDGPWTGSLTLEQVVFEDDWDAYEFMTSGTPIQIIICLIDPTTTAGAGANYWELDCTCVITAIAKSDEGSRRVVELEVAGAYPENSTDGGGYKPANQMTMKWATIVAV